MVEEGRGTKVQKSKGPKDQDVSVTFKYELDSKGKVRDRYGSTGWGCLRDYKVW